MTSDDLEHVAYLGAFAVSGVLCLNDLYRDLGGAYWAEPKHVNSNGSWVSALHKLAATDQDGAVQEALMAQVNYPQREGYRPEFMTIIHHAPPTQTTITQVQMMSAPPVLH